MCQAKLLDFSNYSAGKLPPFPILQNSSDDGTERFRKTTSRQEMKHIHFSILTILFVGLILFGCNQTDRQKTDPRNEISADTTNSQSSEQENAQVNERTEEIKKDIQHTIDIFKTEDIDKIADRISFPLDRGYPIPSIKNKEEFRQRFNEVFDKYLIDKIAGSKIEQWSEMGLSGVMLDGGIIWMSDSDGIITAVNHQSDLEKIVRKNLIEKEKENLHSSLKTFESPTYKIKTKNRLIRIDELIDRKYRYASWRIGEKDSSKPDIILVDGELGFGGSGGNQVIFFTDSISTYTVYRNVIGEENTPAILLEIQKNGKTILKEAGALITE